MAVTLLKRPEGYIISETAVTADGTSNSGGELRITKTAHGLSGGDYIYIKSNVESYNGFWYVIVFNSSTFTIREYSADSNLAFIKEASVLDYYEATASHGWNCVHLPIVYKLSNNLWPINTADTVRVISSVTDSNGYCALSLSGDIKATGSAAVLDSVIVTNANDSDYNGVYQIRAYTNDTTFVIDLAYSLLGSDAALSGASIQFYYNNYVVKAQVWGGLNSGHEYYAQKPYELLGTLDLIPDETGITKFSVSDILKEHIKNTNNLLLGTLPNNLDAWTGFFIKYGEEYDTSDGAVLSRSTVAYTSDISNFQGKAVNAMLPFKNVYSGALSEFSSENSNQKFLTNFIRPTIFSGQYFDLGILWDGGSTIFFKKEFYLNNVLQETQNSEVLDAFYTGVYRHQIEANCDYDRVDVTAVQGDTYNTTQAASWTGAGSFDSTSGLSFTEALTSASSAIEAYQAVSIPDGKTVLVTLTVAISGTWTGSSLGVNISMFLTDSGGTLSSDSSLTTDPVSFLSNGTYTIHFIIRSTAASARMYLRLSQLFVDTGTANVTITMPSQYQLFDTNGNSVVSETKTIDIDCECLQSKATGYNLQWLNNLGHFDSWYFKAYADQIIDIVETEETETNLFEDWPNSYGEFADTVNKETSRRSRQQFLCRSEGLTLVQMNAIKFIKSSPLVQIVNSIYDRTTVILDRDSFTAYKEGQLEQYTISFICTYTNDIPSQPG